MAVDNFMVPPVERNHMPLVARRSGVREYQQKDKGQHEHSESNHKEEKKSKELPSKLFGCLISGNRIDCRV